MAEGGSKKNQEEPFSMATNRTKRLLKNIPKLENEVQMLTQRKDQLSSITPSSSSSPSYSVQASMQPGNEEISVQVSTRRSDHTIPISEVMRELEEEDGLLLMDASSSELYTGRIFHRLHIKVEANREINCESLREKILNLCQNWEMSTDEG